MDQSSCSGLLCGRQFQSRCTKAIYLILLLQIGLVKSVAENFYNPDYEEELNEEWLTGGVPNPTLNEIPISFSDSHPLENLEKQLKSEDFPKRHLGAAVSGFKKPKSGIVEMPKRHLGAIAALKPPKPSLPKRHYASAVASKSGFRSPLGQLSLLDQLSSGSQGMDKRHVGALSRMNPNAFNRIIKSDDGLQFEDEDGSEQFYDVPIDVPIPSNFMTGMQSGVGTDTGDFLDEPINFKNKRFLGSLARVGWFPRQFRGIVADNPFEKRHIGSAARLGWVPVTKSDRLGEFGEGEFKRNIQSLRRLQFTSPTQWGRERARRTL